MEPRELAREFCDLLVLRTVSIDLVGRDKTPVEWGKGCLLSYRSKTFLLTVGHVAATRGLSAMLDVGAQPKDLSTPLYGPISFHTYKKVVSLELFEQAVETQGNLDESNLELFEFGVRDLPINCVVMDRGYEYDGVTYPPRQKITIDAHSIAKPNRDDFYGFFGNVNHKFTGALTKADPKLELNLQFEMEAGDYLLFRAPDIINTKAEYQGCSGAPVMDSKGCFVGLLAQVLPGTHAVFVIPAYKIPNLIEPFLIPDADNTNSFVLIGAK
jgi:hypothetical protein